MDRNLALEVVRVTEAAALESALLMGRGDEAAADCAAAEAMHKLFRSIECKGRVVIGEGEVDSMSILYGGEELGTGQGPELEIALDALEGATTCATGGPNAMSVVAIAEHGSFLRCPQHVYMEKIAVGPAGKGAINLDKSLKENLLALAEKKGMRIENLTVVLLDRPRHEPLINEIRETGARIKLISDGDLAAALATTKDDTGIDILVGTGGAAQGILAAAALYCLGGDMQGRFRPRNQEEAGQLRQCGLDDFHKKLTLEDMVKGNVMVAATGVTSGDYLKGVRFIRGGAVTNSVVMRSKSYTIRFMETTHHFEVHPEYE